MANYQIITDATADLTAELLAQTGVEVIPMELELDGESYTYGPNTGTITAVEFYQQLQLGKWASTSQINPLVYQNCFEKHLKAGKDILYICFSSGLSGTIQAAKLAANELEQAYPDRKLHCVDSLCASVGEGFLVYEAAAKQKAGSSLEELVQWLGQEKLHVCHWFTVEDLEHLRKGGRISAATAMVGTALQIKPVMHMDNHGHLTNVAKARGRKKSLMAMAERLTATWTPQQGNTVMIGHGGCPQDATYLADLVQTAHPEAEIMVMDIGPIIGAHTGPGVVALFFWGTER